MTRENIIEHLKLANEGIQEEIQKITQAIDELPTFQSKDPKFLERLNEAVELHKEARRLTALTTKVQIMVNYFLPNSYKMDEDYDDDYY